MKYIACPDCQKKTGEQNTIIYRKERYFGTNKFYIDTENGNVELEQNCKMYDNAHHACGKWWYCSMCDKRLAKVADDD